MAERGVVGVGSVIRLLLVALLCALLVWGCGSEQPVESTTGTSAREGTTTVPSTLGVDGQIAASLMLGLEDCDRFTLTTLVDPESARTYVPDDLALFDAAGQAVFSFNALSCADLQTDGDTHGPGHFGTVWIRVVDPSTLPPLPPDSGLEADPGDTFYPVLFNTDNEGFAAATTAFGLPMSHADVIELDPPLEGTQTGSMIDTTLVPAVDLSWSVDNQSRLTAGGQVGKHLLLGPDRHDEPLIYYGEFLHAPGWQGNEATIAVAPGAAFEDLIGPSITSSANGDPVTVRMVVFRAAAPG